MLQVTYYRHRTTYFVMEEKGEVKFSCRMQNISTYNFLFVLFFVKSLRTKEKKRKTLQGLRSVPCVVFPESLRYHLYSQQWLFPSIVASRLNKHRLSPRYAITRKGQMMSYLFHSAMHSRIMFAFLLESKFRK